MQSPKFLHKAPHLKKIVAASSLTDLWKTQVRDKMRKQLVPDAVEFLDFHVNIKQRTNELEALVCAGDYIPKPILRLKSEKSKGLCRLIALPSPEDALILQVLSNTLWKDIEPKAPSSKAFFAPEDQPFSKQFPTDEESEWGYGPIEAWLDFQQAILAFSQTREFVVVTDIANYYDFVIHSFLRSILADYGLERESALDLLLFVLDSMLWRPDYMPNMGIGLPQMDLDAPRLLAHTNLFEIDEIFASRPGTDYARYMDDMDFGVDSIAEAKSILRDLDLALQTRNLRLNSGKTKILTASEAVIHFRVKENISLDKLINRIKQRSYLSYWHALYRRQIPRLISSGLKRRAFDDGNGDKILKRLLGLASGLGVSISDKNLREIFYNRPGLRKNILSAWSRSDVADKQLTILAAFLLSGEAVDDLSKILITTNLVGYLVTSKISNAKIYLLLYAMKDKTPFSVFCRLWIASRFDTSSRLWHEIEQTRDVWSRHRFLSRTVAGFYGIFAKTPLFDPFDKLVRRWGGHDAVSVMELHENVLTTKEGYGLILPFIEAKNPSIPVGISHAKSLLLVTAMKNSAVSKLRRARLLGKNSHVMTDLYYHGLLSNIMSNFP